MRRYTVVFVASADAELIDLWLRYPPLHSQITAAVHQLENQLARSPLSVGAEVSEGLYRLDVSPLRVLYTVSDDDRLVEVAAVRFVPS